MERRILRRVGALAGALSAALLLSIGVTSAAAQATLVVDDDGFASPADCDAVTPAFPTISAAEAAAMPGDTIKVCPGLYNEMVFIDVDNLTVLGAQAGVDARTRATLPADESIVDHECGPVQIASDDVVFDGFTAQGANLPPNFFPACFGAGIWTNPGFLGNQGGHQLLNNVVQDNIIGISLANTCGNLLRFNLIRNNDQVGPAGGNGIYSDTPICNTAVDSNTFSGQTSGSILIFGPGQNLEITNNELVGGTPERISVGSTDTAQISGNVSIGSTGANGTIQLFGGTDAIDIMNNTLRDGIRGILVRDPFGFGPNTNVDANFNCIDGNSMAGLQVDAGGHSGTLDAEHNWWGSPSGPLIRAIQVERATPSSTRTAWWTSCPGS